MRATITTPTPTLLREIRPGMAGDDVRAAKALLKSGLGRYSTSAATPHDRASAIANAAFVADIRTVQKRAGIPETGVVDARTWARMWKTRSVAWKRAAAAAYARFAKTWDARVPLSAMPSVRDRVPSYGPFGAGEPSYFVIHDTEGYGSVEWLAGFFRTGPLGSQWAIDATGRIGRYAPGLMTYHVQGHNSSCEGVELVGFDRITRTEWLGDRRTQIDACSWLLAHRCGELGIPVVRASHGDARGFTAPSGIVGHVNVPDNNHEDPGPGFPWDVVLAQASAWQARGSVPLIVAQRVTAANH